MLRHLPDDLLCLNVLHYPIAENETDNTKQHWDGRCDSEFDAVCFIVLSEFDKYEMHDRSHHEECKGCGLCVKRCPVGAQRLEDSPQANNRLGKLSVASIERCIGCGVCAHTCPVDALTLERCEATEDPPKDVREFARHFLTDISAAQARRQRP